MSYLQFLNVLFSWGAKLKDHWPLILAAYQALKALYDATVEPVDGGAVDGTLSMHAFTPDEQDAEERVLAIVQSPGSQEISFGKLFQIYTLLKSTGILDRWLGAFGS